MQNIEVKSWRRLAGDERRQKSDYRRQAADDHHPGGPVFHLNFSACLKLV
jgi:hypothetical protein